MSLVEDVKGELLADVVVARINDGAIRAGDQVHDIVKAEAMKQPTVRMAMAIGIHVAAQLLCEAIEFGQRSVDGGEDAATLEQAAFALFRDLIEDSGHPGAFERRH